jgi:hypothetical protein
MERVSVCGVNRNRKGRLDRRVKSSLQTSKGEEGRLEWKERQRGGKEKRRSNALVQCPPMPLHHPPAEQPEGVEHVRRRRRRGRIIVIIVVVVVIAVAAAAPASGRSTARRLGCGCGGSCFGSGSSGGRCGGDGDGLSDLVVVCDARGGGGEDARSSGGDGGGGY